MRTTDFDQLVERALSNIPARFRRRMQNVAIMVEDEPSPDQLKRGGNSPGTTVLGVYEGRPLRDRSVSESFHLPDRITIFQAPHERIARDANT